jgi:hypothetical protein
MFVDSVTVITTLLHTQVYLDVKVEGERLGRIVVELLDDVAVGSQRFADLAEGKQGVGYRLSKFDGIFSVSCRWFFLQVILQVLSNKCDLQAAQQLLLLLLMRFC